MPKLLQKLTFSILSALIVLFSFAPYLSVKAADPTPAPRGTWYNSNFGDWFNKVYDPNVSPESEIFGERYTAAQVQWVFYSLMALIVNQVITPELTSCFLTNTTDLNACAGLLTSVAPTTNVATAQPETLPSLFSLVFATDRPLSGISYVKEKLSNFSLVPVAKAQGVGFGYNALSIVQNMWSASRDISFGLFVIAAIVFAFMIMFRVKISPQVVISVQSAIPKLIIALILVTFSFAIAGFLIDLMYVVYGILSLMGRSFFSISPFDLNPSSIFQFLTAGRIGIGSFGADTGILGLISLYIITFAFVLLSTLLITQGFLLSSFAAILTGVASVFVPPLGVILLILVFIVFIIAAIILVWHCIKIIWTLLKAFVNILLLTIFAPLQIVAGLFVPSLGFSNWIKSFVSNLAVFVVVSMLLLMSYVFLMFAYDTGVEAWLGGGLFEALANILWGTNIMSAANNLGTSSAWPPLLGATGIGNGGVGNGGAVALLMVGVSFVMFTLIPKSAEIVQGFVSGKPFAYGAAISEAMGAPGRVAMGAMNLSASAGKAYQGLKDIGIIGSGAQTGGQLDPVIQERLSQQRRGGGGVRTTIT